MSARFMARIVALGALTLAAVVVHLAPIVAEPWAPARFHGPDGLAALLVRTALLTVALGEGFWLAGAVVVLFLSSLSFQGLFPVFAFVAVASTLRRNAANPGAPFALVCLLGALAARAFPRDRGVVPVPPDNLADQVSYYDARGNPMRARAAAAEWCRRESPPGVGCLVLAEAEYESQETARAVERARGVLAENPDPPVRERATKWLVGKRVSE